MRSLIVAVLALGVPVAPAWAQSAIVAARDIARGDIISASDIGRVAAPGNARRALAASPAEVIGMEAKRLIRSGRHIATSDIRPAALIRKGDPVTVEYAWFGIRVSASGRALADARHGGSLAVMNLYSNRSVRAVAVAPGLVRVSPR